MKQGIKAEKFILPHWWTSVIWRKSNWRQSTKNTKAESYSEVMLWQMIQDHTQYLLNKIISITNDGSKSDGHYIKSTKIRRTRSRRSIGLHPGKNGRCTITVKNFEVRMSRYLDSSTTTQMAWIMVQYGRSSRSSWAKSGRSCFCRTLMVKAIREICIKTILKISFTTLLGKSSKLGMFVRYMRKRTILVCVCGWCKNYSCLCMWRCKNWLERNRTLVQHGQH